VDGSSFDLFLIPVLGVIALSAWLVVVFIADPEWRARRTAAARTIARLAQLEIARLALPSDAEFAEPAQLAVIIHRSALGAVPERPFSDVPQLLSAAAARGDWERPAA
jgi:hypothetical protein